MSAVMSDDGHDKTEHDSSKQVDNDDIGQEEGGVPDYYSDYDWEEALSDSDVESEAKGMDLAKADADALTVDLDGMYAKVEAHTSTTIRLWVCVEHWRLFEGLAPRTVETLGLDPSKDVVVMFTTDQQYTGSVEPKVQWARQVDPDKSKADDLCPEGRIGEIFPLQETLCQKLNEDLARMWPRAADRTRARRKHSHQSRIGAGASASDGSNDNGPSLQAGVTQGGGGGLSGHGGDRAAAAAALGSEEVGAGAAAGGVAAGPDSSAARLAIESICGSTGGLREHVASAGKTSEAVHLEAITAHRMSGELQTNRRTAKRQCQSLSDLDGRTAKLEQLAETNPLARAALTITIKLRNANKNCLLCDDPIEGFLPAVPIVCPKEFCQWRSGQMRCGTDVESQVLKNGETVGLLINLFAMAIRSDRAELNFPDTAFKHVSLANDVCKVRQALRALPTVADMQLCIKRKRGKHPRAEGTTTTTSTSSSPAPPPLAEEEARKLTDAAHAATTKAAAAKSRAAAAERVAVGEASSDVAALADVHAADASPEVRARAVDAVYAARARAVTATAESAAAAAKSREAAQEAATAVARAAAAMGDDRASRFGVVGGGIAGPRGGEGDRPDGSRLLSLEQELTRRDPSSYGLLQWLLSTNRAYLRPLRESEHIPEIPCEKQFMFVTGTVHREAKFQEMKRKEVALSEGGKKTGSFYAFYGCAPGNWHGIFQEGFKNMSGSRSTSSGAALGSDIHMTTRLSVALGHAGGWKDSFIWKMGNNDMERGETPVIVAICEVIDRDSNLISDPNAGSYVVSDEECVATRFLLVNPSTTARAELFDADGGIQASHLTINPQA